MKELSMDRLAIKVFKARERQKRRDAILARVQRRAAIRSQVGRFNDSLSALNHLGVHVIGPWYFMGVDGLQCVGDK